MIRGTTRYVVEARIFSRTGIAVCKDNRKGATTSLTNMITAENIATAPAS